jgi:uncharacterized protein YjbJ (UPF0337 family)
MSAWTEAMTRPNSARSKAAGLTAPSLPASPAPWRYIGLGLVVPGFVLLTATRLSGAGVWHSGTGRAALAAFVIGWALAIVGMVRRTRCHRRRMAGRPEPNRASLVPHPTCFSRRWTMGELKDRIKGNVNEAVGRAKQQSGDPETRDQGAGQELKGKGQQLKGAVKGAINRL